MKRLRFWLIRKLLHTDRLQEATKTAQLAVYKTYIDVTAKQLADATEKLVNEHTATIISKFDIDILVKAIAVNEHLTLQQKDAIMHILQTKPDPNTTSYLR